MLFVLTSWWSGFPGKRIISQVDTQINDRTDADFSLAHWQHFFSPCYIAFLLYRSPTRPQNLLARGNLVKTLGIIFLMFLYRVKPLSQDDYQAIFP